MSEKTRENKISVDYESFANPDNNSEALASNPDAWIKPEMLRKISQKNTKDSDNEYLSNE